MASMYNDSRLLETSRSAVNRSTNSRYASAAAPAPAPVRGPSSFYASSRAAPPQSTSMTAAEARREELLQREAELVRQQLAESRLRESVYRDRTSRLDVDQHLLETSLVESRVAEDTARNASRALARELAASREDLNASRRSEEHVRTTLDASLSETYVQLEDGKRSQQRLALKEDEVQHVHRLLDAAQRDLRRREEDLRQKDAHIRHLENTLRMRQDAHADLKLLVEDLRRDIQEKNESVASLERALRDAEERLAHAKGDTRRVEDALAGLRDRAEQYEKDMQYELANVKQSRAAVEHDLAAAVSNLRDREEDLQYAAKRTEELEGYIASLRREVHARDEKLDQRHEEIERWTSECDRLRRQLDEARDRAIQNSSEHDRRIKEEKLLQQDMHARLSSAEVEKSVAVAAKTDLIHDVARLQRRVDDQEEQISRLTRALEEKDQRIAELGPLVRDTQRKRTATRATVTAAPRVNRPRLPRANLDLGSSGDHAYSSGTTRGGSSKWRY